MLSPSSNLRGLAGRFAIYIAMACLLFALLAPIFIHHSNSLFINSSVATSADSANNGAEETIEVKQGSIKKYLLLDGELQAVRSRTIYGSASEEAKIVYMPPEGSVVKAGDLALGLESTNTLSKIKDTEERITAAEGEIVKLRSQHESALRDLEVELSKLWLDYEKAKLKAKIPNEVVSRREFQEAQLTLDKAKTGYENQLKKIEEKKKEQEAELKVKIIEKEKLEVQIDRAKTTLEEMKIKAPITGMVLYNDHWTERRKIQIGDAVWGGLPVIRLPDLSEMEVLAEVNEVDGPKLSVGAPAEVKIDSYPDKVIPGKIKDISQTAVKSSWMAKARIFRVTVSLDHTLIDIMKPGMSTQISVAIGCAKPNLLILRSAVAFDGDRAMVRRIESGSPTRAIAVTILATDGLNYLVADNGALKAGDRIAGKAELLPGE